MTTLLPLQTNIVRDNRGVVSRISHARSLYQTTGFVPANVESLANWYLQKIGSLYGIEPSWLVNRPEAAEDDADKLLDTYQVTLADIKPSRDIIVVSFSQSYAGLPVFMAGLAVRICSDLSSVISSQSTLHLDIEIDTQRLKSSRHCQVIVTEEQLSKMLGLGSKTKRPKVNTSHLVIYRYLPETRFDPANNEEGQPPSSPKLKLPEVPDSILSGKHYIVRDVLFSLELPDWGVLEWRALIEVDTNSILYLRASVESCTGAIFRDDPITISGDVTNSSCAPLTTLDSLSEVVTLQGLTLSDPQSLSGEYVQMMDTDQPNVAPPTATLPACEFNFPATSDDFSAVNAYYHMDALYRMVEDMGFVNYFSGTSFPIPMDHRGENGARNAHHHGSGSGTTKYRFGLAEIGCPVGIACDRRIVIHEFGHSVLRNHINSGVFSFAHGVGDTMAVILSDPNSQVPDRFDTFPFTTITRRHDRDIAMGWGWGGANDTGSYSSTQILSTTMFRAYRSLGGDANMLEEQKFAARFVTYLILTAVSLETPLTQPAGPEEFAEDLIEADLVTTAVEGHPGGAFHKVIRWAFEKQDAYGGQPPEVDVYIDDGRNGEYPWLDNFTDTADIWTRYEPDGGTVHQNPLVGTPMFVYVKVRNRGTQAVSDIIVKGFRGPPGSRAVWPNQFTPLATAELSVPGPIPSGGNVIVGPFELTLETTKGDSIIMSTSTPQDVSNIDTITESLETRRFVPYDNNMAQRDIKAIPYPVQYSVKFVCGTSSCDCGSGPVAPGSYFTAINILNPTDQKMRFRKKIAVALPGERTGHVTPFTFNNLGPCEALEIDCADIHQRIGLPDGCFLKGFVIIQSLVELDVVAVYSAAGADKQVETLDVEYIAPRIMMPDDIPPPEETRLPDLVPLPAFPPPSPNAPGQLPQNFCFSTVGSNKANAIRIIVRNEGNGDATESSITEVKFGNNPPTQVETPAIAAGGEAVIEVMIPDGCFVGESSCNFDITVDATSVIDESDETNNTTSGFCPGIVS
ncbi:MAG: CARDB domain-containing protein [Methylococcales bacterium]